MAENSASKENFIKRFFKGLKAEWKKIAWPTKEQTAKQTVVVVVISLVLAAFIRLIDVLSELLIAWVGQIGA